MGWLAACVAVLVALFATACGPREGERTEDALLVAAASDLRPVMPALLRRYEAMTGQRVTVTFGSSGQLAHQIVEGAPYDLFAAADSSFVDLVLDAGRGEPASRSVYALGRLAVWARADRWAGWSDLPAVGADTAVRTVAIANPGHAPYGRAARQALVRSGSWGDVEPRVVLGESIIDAHGLAASGNADVVLTALPLAIAAGEAGEWMLVPADLHDPLEQTSVITATQPERRAQARAFADLLTSREGQEVLRRYGLRPPGERPPRSWEE